MNQEQLKRMRHSLAHIMAQAVLKVRPEAKLGIGPDIDNGFYYDFDLGEESFSDKNLKEIAKEMRKVIQSNQKFEQYSVSVEEAKEKMKNNPYKLELINDLEKEGEKEISFYKNVDAEGGMVFEDMCRGPHVGNSSEVGAFKLTKVAGAYWRGNEKNKMMQRLYALAFETEAEIEAYLEMLKEAEKRDHRKLGKDLDLFTFSDLVGPGLPLWTPKGTLLRNILDDFVWKLRSERGYQKVSIPHITKKELYETSGHWQKFSEELYKVKTREGHEFAMKPMNCPHHTQIYKHLPRSYRDLPQRYAETTVCYRDEQTGELHGISRTRAFAQDDAHVFCRHSQVKEEFLKIWDMVDIFYKAVGFDVLNVRLSLHDPDNFKAYLGTPEMWAKAETSIRELAEERGVAFVEQKGEAAFYGPKVDFMAKDSIGREWQVATIQLDINLPARFDLTCTNEKGEAEQIVMVHAAIMGSIERFLSILIEHHAGDFPLWLAPVQVKVLPISEKFNEYAEKVYNDLKSFGWRIELDRADESLGKKIRKAEKEKVPYVLVVGEKEVEAKTVAVRSRSQGDLGAMKVEEFVKKAI